MICPLFPGGTKYAASCLDGAPNPDLARSEFGPCSDCPVDFGPWGEWRAGLAETMDAARHYNEMGNLKRIVRAINATGAVGWP